MKKIGVPLLCVCLFFAGMFLILNNKSQVPDTYVPTEIDSDSITESTGRTVQSIQTSSDLAVVYSDYKSLIADSEYVIFGTVKDLKPYSAVPAQINTEVTVSIENVLKGKIDGDTVNYTVYGGKMSALEWYKANSEKLKDKLTVEVFEKEVAAMNPADAIEAIYMGVENVEVNDQVLVFLVFDDATGMYWIRASSYNGQFFFDKESDSFYKVVNGEKSMFAEYSEVKSLAETTPDNSENLRKEMENRVEIEDDGVITEKDPTFDKYKGE